MSVDHGPGPDDAYRVAAAGHVWLRRPSDVPAYFTAQQAAAWCKGFDFRTSAVISRRTDVDTHAATPPYRREGMRFAWSAGWNYAKQQEGRRG